MYRVFKPEGYDKNVTVENTDTYSSIMIGKLSPTITKILDDAGYTDIPSTPDEWSFEVNEECAKALASLAMRMKKPIRDQSKKATEEKIMSKTNDVFDQIFGTVY